MRALPKLGVGLAYQAPLRSLFDDGGTGGIAAVPAGFDYAEIVPDIFWADAGPVTTETHTASRYRDDDEGRILLNRIRHLRPLVAHSIGLSIGSADTFDRGHVAQMRHWWQHFHFPWHSDHLAFHLADLHATHGRDDDDHDSRKPVRANAGITLPMARDRESVDLLVPRIAAVMREIPAPFLLENNVYYFDIPDAEYDEAQFLNTLCRESGCGLLLDLHNLYTNSRNHGFDAMAMLSSLDLSLVGEIHVAGGMELDGFYLDAHSDVVPDDVWTLLEWTLPRCPNIGGVTFELFGSWVETVGLEQVHEQLRRLRVLWAASQPAPHTFSTRCREESAA